MTTSTGSTAKSAVQTQSSRRIEPIFDASGALRYVPQRDEHPAAHARKD